MVGKAKGADVVFQIVIWCVAVSKKRPLTHLQLSWEKDEKVRKKIVLSERLIILCVRASCRCLLWLVVILLRKRIVVVEDGGRKKGGGKVNGE